MHSDCVDRRNLHARAELEGDREERWLLSLWVEKILLKKFVTHGNQGKFNGGKGGTEV